MTKSTGKTPEQLLWERIANRPESIVLQRMRANGFWPSNTPIPTLTAPELAERHALEVERQRLQSTVRAPQNSEALLEAERARRMAETRARQKARRAQRQAAAAARRAAFAQQKQTTVVHAGLGVSSRLQHTVEDSARLTALGLPSLPTAQALADWLGLSLASLRFLTFHRRGAVVVHYHRFAVAKKSGGQRFISAPKTRLKQAQRVVLTQLLERVPLHDAAHGFVRERSIVSNATPHVHRPVVVNMDLRDFFPSVSFVRVRGVFAALGYSGQVATLLALLCTEPPRQRVAVDGEVLHIALGERVLPQGAPTSPAITNILCRRLDARLRGAAHGLGFVYTRYADDLTFSTLQRSPDVGPLLARTRRVLAHEGFNEHPDKTRVMRQGRRQEVTGVVVNDKLSLARHEVRALRATLFNCIRFGLDSQNRDAHPHFRAHLAGKVAYLSMVDPARGARLRTLLDRIPTTSV